MICTLHMSSFYWSQMWVGTPKWRVGTIEQPLLEKRISYFDGKYSNPMRRFSANELQKVTDNYNHENLVMGSISIGIRVVWKVEWFLWRSILISTAVMIVISKSIWIIPLQHILLDFIILKWLLMKYQLQHNWADTKILWSFWDVS